MRSGRSGHGFALVLLLVLVAVIATVTAGAVQAGHTAGRRSAEAALLVAGEDFHAALVSWRRGAPGASVGPAELAELVRDPRVPGVQRHLRQIPYDPLTGRAEWGLLRDNAGRIVAVHSLAPGQPITRRGFAPTQAGFEDASSYAQWQFGFRLPARPPGPASPAMPSPEAR